jgi:hypothetical protein
MTACAGLRADIARLIVGVQRQERGKQQQRRQGQPADH